MATSALYPIRLLSEQNRLLHKNIVPGQVATVFNGLVVVWVMWQQLPWIGLLIWYGLQVLTVLGRLHARHQFLILPLTEVAQGNWQRRFVRESVLSGAIWGAGACLIIPQVPIPHQAFYALVCAGMVGGAVPYLSGVATAYRLYSGAVSLPLAVVLLAEQSMLPVAMGMMSIIFFFVVNRSASLFSRTLTTSIQLNDEKERLIADLDAARNRAENANRDKTCFLSVLSHEVRTPLNGIIGMTDLMLQGPVLEEHKLYLQHVRASGQDLTRVFDQLLEYAALEAGQVTPQPQPCAVTQLLDDLAHRNQAAAAKKGIQLQTTTDSSIPTLLYGDARMVGQIIQELVDNAIKFTERGSITIAATLQQHDPGQRTVRFDVIDTGCGIPMERQADIFTSFVQADGSATRRHGGTGLGLALVSRWVEHLNGSLMLRSDPDEGSTFSVFIPFDLHGPTAPHPASTSATPAAPPAGL